MQGPLSNAALGHLREEHLRVHPMPSCLDAEAFTPTSLSLDATVQMEQAELKQEDSKSHGRVFAAPARELQPDQSSDRVRLRDRVLRQVTGSADAYHEGRQHVVAIRKHGRSKQRYIRQAKKKLVASSVRTQEVAALLESWRIRDKLIADERTKKF